MGIRVGYEPVASIGGMAVQSGRNTYEKWLAEQRRKALEMQQQAQLQAQQIAANKEAMEFRARVDAQSKQREYERQQLSDEQKNKWSSDEADKQRRWQEAENEKTRKYKDSTEEEKISNKLAGLSAAFGDNPLAQSTLTPELKGAYDNAASVAGSMADDNFKGMLQGLGPLQQPPEDADTSAFKRQYTPSQKRELESIYISKDKIENYGELSKAEKAYALDKLLQRRDQILRSPVPVLPEKSPIRVEKLPNGIEVIIDQNGGIHKVSEFDGSANMEKDRMKRDQKASDDYDKRREKYIDRLMRQKDEAKLPKYTLDEAMDEAERILDKKRAENDVAVATGAQEPPSEWSRTPEVNLWLERRKMIGEATGVPEGSEQNPTPVLSMQETMRIIPGQYFITPDGRKWRKK